MCKYSYILHLRHECYRNMSLGIVIYFLCLTCFGLKLQASFNVLVLQFMLKPCLHYLLIYVEKCNIPLASIFSSNLETSRSGICFATVG